MGSAELGRYWLGIDVGSTAITAAICREEAGGRTQHEVVSLGNRSAGLRSVVHLGPDGQVLVGEAAERRAAAEPDRVVRELKRHLSDGLPMLIGGVPHPAPALTAAVVSWVVDRVAQQEGGSACGVTLTHPAGWDAGKIQEMADALSAVPLPQVRLCTEPAAAAAYSIREWLDVGSTIAVYDLGGGSFDAAVLRKTGKAAFATLGIPESIGRLGGTDFDDAVFGHVLAAVPALSELEPEATEEGRLQRSVALCRRECIEAKEALSVGTEVTIPVLLPRIQSQVHLTRSEFEDLICPQVAETVEALRRTLRSAEVAPEDLDVVLLVGGSSRIPLVAQLLSAELGRPVAVDPDPQSAVALGAAVSGMPAGSVYPAANGGAIAGMDVGVTSVAGSDAPDPATTQLPPWVTATAPDVEPPEAPSPRTSSPWFTKYAAAGLLALVLVGGAVAMPLLTSHRGPVPEPAAGSPVPPQPVRNAPVSQVPVPRVPAPQNVVPQVPEPQVPEPQVPGPQTPVAAVPDPAAGSVQEPLASAAAPAEPAKSSRTAPQHTSGNRAPSRPKPPPAPPPPPPPKVPDWVKSARSDP